MDPAKSQLGSGPFFNFSTRPELNQDFFKFKIRLKPNPHLIFKIGFNWIRIQAKMAACIGSLIITNKDQRKFLIFFCFSIII